MNNDSRGTGQHLTPEQRVHVQAPHSPNEGVDINFQAVVEELQRNEYNEYSDISSFDWEMFEKGSVYPE